MGLPGKASAGQRMMDTFHPIMQPQADSARLVPILAMALHMTPVQARAMMATQLPSMSAMLSQLPAMQHDFGGLFGAMTTNVGIVAQVPAELRHDKPLVTTMKGNVSNYRQIDSLPDFRLFTVFFVVPGALLVLLAAAGLWGDRITTAVHLGHGRRLSYRA